jgi:NAD(P)-dependent dehydrogenase (short-subunit alcohol dehydrogenase family)
MTQTPPIALITGASRGIGHEVARQLAATGVVVLAGVRDPGRDGGTLAGLPGDVRPVHLDVTDEATIAAAAAMVAAEHGRLDILVNNAGISLERGAGPLDVDAQTVRRTYETNVFGVVAVTHALLPMLQRSAAGRIVNVSSAMGSLGEWSDPESPLVKFAPVALAYNSSKTALNAITVAYAHALRGSGIKVNSADPGYVATDLNGHSGYRSAAEGARTIVQLAMLADDGPTGNFLSDAGPVPW